MAPTATTADVFGAIAEPQRRRILDLLAEGERSVGDLVETTGLTQPQVSKHLRVLREVGVVDVREDGRRRFYRIDGAALKPIHDWVTGFEALWAERYEALDAVLADLKQKETGDVDDQQ
ncbi:ArsR/SmtB family transcription factor [Baekduia sp. Peel2402]|uniref:ArsR/SmtB family transcription factor n=1 Tax=Baekduia sp. Peel2402 TaxID=3458296 RepID=UPI00403EE302